MIKVKFVKDKVYPFNGKTFTKGTIIVLSDEILKACLEDGSAVPYAGQSLPEELEKELNKKKK